MLAADVAPNTNTLVETSYGWWWTVCSYSLCSKVSVDLLFVENFSIVGGLQILWELHFCRVSQSREEMYYAKE